MCLVCGPVHVSSEARRARLTGVREQPNMAAMNPTGFFRREANGLNCWAISPAPNAHFLNYHHFYPALNSIAGSSVRR